MKLISSKRAPKAVGPYSHAAILGKTLCVSGQLPLDPKTMGLVSDDVMIQTKQCLRNGLAIVEDAGSSKARIARVAVYLTDMDDFDRVNDVYETFFGGHKPARLCFAVAALPMAAKVEIEFIADLS
ncbi:Rid family detoxifying hydrolase [Vibrio coralliilyticus]|uniref:Reactive intermediate/imine deaminase n=1 Tax=Vibrio coralliilyticus TaxID=190893 RepID=A0AAP7DDP7_9VIBR|nr:MULTISPECIES: Rid family detoxifying hydrolase [Vibrio]NOI77465.1 reactive intermediate/imine deaminase [Vibrio coralliilyticus]NOJ24233.1 reactive intermediate/imine deaminase [Vibrio coralliilyticus]NRF16275.1 reactive intermediate/imine deaminase [Vibrio coralliilyticus]NRF33058.1 reactive intermediate/imine deaminase [Vibrio coralliilyticus]NRF55528.1 reactive intermediate/imine deaminase [Vibrio coralliilyticus]